MSDTETIEKRIEELTDINNIGKRKILLMRYAREDFNRGVDALAENIKNSTEKEGQ